MTRNHGSTSPISLYHYTCDHGAEHIASDGVLLPQFSPVLGRDLVWLTDLETPIADGLGLTSRLLSCDRTAHRFTVLTLNAIWWPAYARQCDRSARRMLDSAPGAMPAHWWVSESQLPIRKAVTA